MEAVLNQIEQDGFQINDDDLHHISPARFEHINKYGKYTFSIDQ